MYRLALLAALLLTSVGLFGQAEDTPYQVRYAANLNKQDSFLNVSNTGANGAPLTGPGGAPVGNICVNLYAFSPDAQLIACCSCLVPPNGLESWSVKNDIINNPATPAVPNSVEIALIASLAGAGGTGSSCANSAATVGSGGTIATGMAAWMATTHVNTVTTPGQYWWQPATTTTTTYVDETPFTPSTLSAGELASLTNRCSNIIGNASGFGICRSCTQGGR
jgi:hypothetical protein